MPLRVLLTGANGFIGQHILAAFLEAGHSVRSVVRSDAKASQLLSTFGRYGSQLDTVVVQDLTAPGALDTALQGTAVSGPFDTVVHTASPFNYRLNSSAADFLDPAVRGTREMLASVVRAGPSVRRVVITSSMASVIDWSVPRNVTPEHGGPKVYTEEDWNPVTMEKALSPGTAMSTIYQASKKFAERAAWEFVERERPGFDLVTLQPPMVYGPLYDPAVYPQTAGLPESVYGIYGKTLAPSLSEASELPPTVLHLYVDVRDVARAHLLAATVEAAGSKRFILCAEQGDMSNQRVVDIFRQLLPEMKGRIPKGVPGSGLGEGIFRASSKRAREVLGLTFRTPEETMGDMAKQLVEYAKKE